MSKRVSVVFPGLIGDYVEKRMNQLGLTPSQFLHIMVIRDLIRPLTIEEAGILSIGVGRMKSGGSAEQVIAGLAPLFEREGYSKKQEEEEPLGDEDVKKVVSDILAEPISEPSKAEEEPKQTVEKRQDEPKMGNMTGYI